MSIWVKICGLTSRDAVQAAVEGGADAVGFVFADSPRRVTPAEARRFCEGLPEGVLRVAVMRHPAAEEWRAVREVFAPDWLQTEAADFAALELGAECSPLPVFRDNGVTIDDFGKQMPPVILFEGARSGAGETADWSAAAALARCTRLVLAGGLSASNVTAAIARVGPWGVDVSSGVEAAPGRKDPERIREFLHIVRQQDAGAGRPQSREAREASDE